MFDEVIAGIRKLFGDPPGHISLHAPWFDKDDEDALVACVRSTFVSSVGPEITAFEKELAAFTGAPYAVAVGNGTAALHTALMMTECGPGDLVITQPFTFIATCNAIAYTGAQPVFLDIETATLGLSPTAVLAWLEMECSMKGGICVHNASGMRVRACVPMHSFGLPMHINTLLSLCAEWNITVIEDAAEALGSYLNGKHMGTFAPISTFSFNGNKIITCGGGGALLFHDEGMAKRAKHLTTQAKVPHQWNFDHDRVGYNYRMPNLNAALLRSQMRKLPHNLASKRALHKGYIALFANTPWTLVTEPVNTQSNFWLNAVLLRNKQERDAFLAACHAADIHARPAWELATDQVMYSSALRGDLSTSRDIQDRLVNLPSSAQPAT
ncbi:MAG: LegC family aminotransferase [Flavobacteriales bacterium]